MALPTDTGSGSNRILGKLDSYKGDRDHWHTWKFAFKCYIGALSPGMLARLNVVETSATPVQLASLTEDEQGDARQLAFLLSQTLKASALTLLMNVEDQNGFEAWRRLSQREDPTTGSTQVAKLQALLKSTFWDDPIGYVSDLEAFEQRVKLYETGTGELIADALMQALVKEGSPTALWDYLAVQTFASFNHLRECIVTYYASRHSASSSGAVPMDVGGIYGSKGKDKGKGKQKGKTKGKDTKGKSKGGKGHPAQSKTGAPSLSGRTTPAIRRLVQPLRKVRAQGGRVLAEAASE